MPALNRMPATRVVANRSALDAAEWPVQSLVLRLATDETLIIPPVPNPTVADPHAIIVTDMGFAGVWLPAADALAFLERACEWALPTTRPAFAQGAIAGVPTKLWLESDRILFLVPAPYIHDLEERLA